MAKKLCSTAYDSPITLSSHDASDNLTVRLTACCSRSDEGNIFGELTLIGINGERPSWFVHSSPSKFVYFFKGGSFSDAYRKSIFAELSKKQSAIPQYSEEYFLHSITSLFDMVDEEISTRYLS